MDLKLFRIRQSFTDRSIDIKTELPKELNRLSDYPFPGKNIAVASGSRGITDIDKITGWL